MFVLIREVCLKLSPTLGLDDVAIFRVTSELLLSKVNTVDVLLLGFIHSARTADDKRTGRSVYILQPA